MFGGLTSNRKQKINGTAFRLKQCNLNRNSFFGNDIKKLNKCYFTKQEGQRSSDRKHMNLFDCILHAIMPVTTSLNIKSLLPHVKEIE